MWAIDANPATTVLQQQKSKEKHHVKIHMKRCIHPGPTKTGSGGIVIHWKPHVTVAGKLCCCGQASRCWSSSCWWRECVFLWSLLMHTRARGGRELSCLSSHTHTQRLEPFVFCLLIHWLSQILSRWLGEEGEHCHFIGQTSVYSKRGTVSHGGTRKETEKVKTKFITVRWEWQWDVAKPCFLYSAVIAVGNPAKPVVSHSTTNSCIIAVLYCWLWYTRCCYEPFYSYCLRGPFHQARCCTSKMSGAAPR